MVKVLYLSFTVLFFITLFFTIPPRAFAQNQQTSVINVGDVEVIDPGDSTPGDFRSPFKCGLAYWGDTYAGHSAYSVDFNRGGGYDDFGDPVLASAPGKVRYILWDYGQVHITHSGNYETVYVHMKNITVRVGDQVVRGQKIGEVGDTHAPGQSHLHVNHVRNGQRIQVSYHGKPYPTSLLVGRSVPAGPLVRGECD